MRERVFVLALAAGALGLFYLLFFPKPAADSNDIALPLSSETRPEGYLALWRWLGEQRIPTVSLRYRYDRLAAMLPRPTGNLLVISMPQRVTTRSAELTALDDWLARGNTLLLIAAIHDTPPWILAPDSLLAERVEHLTGLHLQVSRSQNADLKAMLADRLTLQPRGEHPLLAGVSQIVAVSALPFRRGQLKVGGDVLPLELAQRADSGETSLWLIRRGAGQVILSTVASPFANGAIALGDNARLLANIVAWSVRPGAAVVFDDAHQGATAYYDGRAFFADPRLHRTLGWIVLLWLAFVLGPLPLRAVQRSWQPIDEAAYVEASARYFAAVVPRNEAAQRLIENFLRQLNGGSHDREEPLLWQRFDSDPRVSAKHSGALHTLYENACAGRRIDLVRLQNLLAQLRKTLQ